MDGGVSAPPAGVPLGNCLDSVMKSDCSCLTLQGIKSLRGNFQEGVRNYISNTIGVNIDRYSCTYKSWQTYKDEAKNIIYNVTPFLCIKGITITSR